MLPGSPPFNPLDCKSDDAQLVSNEIHFLPYFHYRVHDSDGAVLLFQRRITRCHLCYGFPVRNVLLYCCPISRALDETWHHGISV